MNLDYPSPFRRQPKSVRTPPNEKHRLPLCHWSQRGTPFTGWPEVYVFTSSGGLRRRRPEVGLGEVLPGLHRVISAISVSG